MESFHHISIAIITYYVACVCCSPSWTTSCIWPSLHSHKECSAVLAVLDGELYVTSFAQPQRVQCGVLRPGRRACITQHIHNNDHVPCSKCVLCAFLDGKLTLYIHDNNHTPYSMCVTCLLRQQAYIYVSYYYIYVDTPWSTCHP